jgi:hypothetical protein
MNVCNGENRRPAVQRKPPVATVGFRETQRLSCKRSFVSFSIAAIPAVQKLKLAARYLTLAARAPMLIPNSKSLICAWQVCLEPHAPYPGFDCI